MVGLALLTLAFVSALVGSNNSGGYGCLRSAFSLLTGCNCESCSTGGCHDMNLSCDLALSEGAMGKGEEGERFLRLIWDLTFTDFPLFRFRFPVFDNRLHQLCLFQHSSCHYCCVSFPMKG